MLGSVILGEGSWIFNSESHKMLVFYLFSRVTDLNNLALLEILIVIAVD